MRDKQRPYWKRIVVLLCMGWVVIWLARTMLAPIYGEIQDTVGRQSAFHMGMISSMYFLGYVLVQIPSGLLMDRVGRKSVMLPGFALFFVGLLVIGFAHHIETIFVGSLLTGIGTGTYYSGAFSLSGQYVPPQYRYFATAVINNGCAVGVVLGYLSGGILVKACGVHWKATVFVTAALTLLCTAALAAGVKRDLPARGQAPAAVQAPPRGRTAGFFTGKMLATYFLYFSACYGYYMIVTWLPSFLEKERGILGGAASVYACVVALASIPGAMLFGKLLDRFCHRRVAVMAVLQIAAALLMVLIARSTALALLLPCLMAYGFFGKQAIDPLIVPHVSDAVAAAQRATGLGIFNFFGMSGSVFAPSVTGYMGDLFGSQTAGFYIAAALLGASALLFAVAHRHGAAQRI